MLKRSFPRLFWRIGAVARITGIPQHMLRSWEREFTQLRPGRDPSGVRVYRERDFRIVLLLQNMIERNGQSIAQVRTFLKEDPARFDALLDDIDLEAVLAARRKPSLPSGDRKESPMSDDENSTEQHRNGHEEPGKPNPWDDPALAQPEGEGDDEKAPSGVVMTTDHGPSEAQVNHTEAHVDSSHGNSSGSDEVMLPPEHAPPSHEPLPAWAIAELRALRRELVALEQMIAALAVERPTGDDPTPTKDDD